MTKVQERLNFLRAHGPTLLAFSFTKTFPAPDEVTSPATEGTGTEYV